jgi:hypothetical protein
MALPVRDATSITAFSDSAESCRPRIVRPIPTLPNECVEIVYSWLIDQRERASLCAARLVSPHWYENSFSSFINALLLAKEGKLLLKIGLSVAEESSIGRASLSSNMRRRLALSCFLALINEKLEGRPIQGIVSAGGNAIYKRYPVKCEGCYPSVWKGSLTLTTSFYSKYHAAVQLQLTAQHDAKNPSEEIVILRRAAELYSTLFESSMRLLTQAQDDIGARIKENGHSDVGYLSRYMPGSFRFAVHSQLGTCLLMTMRGSDCNRLLESAKHLLAAMNIYVGNSEVCAENPAAVGSTAYNLSCVYSLLRRGDDCRLWFLRASRLPGFPGSHRALIDPDMEWARKQSWWHHTSFSL